MAITSTEPLTTERRTMRVTVECPSGKPPEVVFTRQVVSRLADGTTLRDFSQDSVRRIISGAVLADSVQVNGLTLTAQDVAAAVAAFGDKWDAEEIAKNRKP